MSNPLWKRLNNAQLQGANAALRLLHTWPRINGQVLAQLTDLIEETYAELAIRKPEPELNEGDEPDTSDCTHPVTCGFCRARASMARKLTEASQSSPSSSAPRKRR